MKLIGFVSLGRGRLGARQLVGDDWAPGLVMSEHLCHNSNNSNPMSLRECQDMLYLLLCLVPLKAIAFTINDLDSGRYPCQSIGSVSLH